MNFTSFNRKMDFIIQILIVFSLCSFTFETLPELNPIISYWLSIIEIITVVIFTIEYCIRIVTSKNKLKFIFSFYGLIDLLAILPFYINHAIDLRSIRVFRLFRLIRMFKLIRYSRAIQRYRKAFMMIKEELIVFLTATIFLIYLSSVGIYYFENAAQPKQFSSIFHCMWWSIVTLTTVGYGDVYPVTIGGKIFTFFVLIIGLGIIAIPTGLIASALTRCIEQEKEERKKEKEELTY